MTTEPIIINVESVCRSCLNDDTEMASLFDTDGTEELRIVDMLESCAFLNVNSNDGFPTQICLQCYTFIHQAYQFKLQCQKSESIIRSFLDAQQTQVIKIEEECISSKNDYGEGETTGQYTTYCDDTDVSKMELIEPMEETVGAYDPEQILSCSDCEERFTSTEALDNHKLIFHDKNEYSCPRCLKKFKQSDLLTVHMRHCETHECEICKKKFRTLGYLQNHMKRHDPDYVASDKRYYCTECDKSYTSPANLAIHQYSHSGIKPFKCEFCGKGFTKAISLNSHKALHTGKKPHICDICERGFTSATILTQHKKIHSGEKPYKCTECERSFTASGDLTIHMRSHTGERPYLCTTCGRSFARITHLNTHIRTHTGEKPYVCSTCNRGFAQSGDLRSHLRTHTGERPFSCKVCNKRFVQSSGLSSHMATHSNEKAYVCDVCNRAFSQSASLTRHAKAHIVMS